jgi:hypothetical protein
MSEDKNMNEEDSDQICKKCNKTFDPKSKKYIFLPLGYADPTTDTFISTKEWCLDCCIKLEQGVV